MKKSTIILCIWFGVVFFLLPGLPVKAETIHDENVIAMAEGIINQQEEIVLQMENGNVPDFVSIYREACNLNHNVFYCSIYNLEEVTCVKDDSFVYYHPSYQVDSGNIEQALSNTLEDAKREWGDQFYNYSKRKKFALISKYIKDNFVYYKDSTGNPIFEPLNISLPRGQVVCGGFSSLISYLCDYAGIENKFHWSDTHVWNSIRLDNDEYIFVDGTNNSDLFVSENVYELSKDYSSDHEAGFADWKEELIYNVYLSIL